MKRIAVALTFCLFLSACGEDSAQQAIEANGFTEVTTLPGIVWWGCDKNDNFFYNAHFLAKGANGKRVEGVVCGGVLKGWTVRIERVLG